MDRVDGRFDEFLRDIAPAEADPKKVATKRILYRSSGGTSLRSTPGFRGDDMDVDLDAFEMPVGSQSIDSDGGRARCDALYPGGKSGHLVGSEAARRRGNLAASGLSLEKSAQSGPDAMSIDSPGGKGSSSLLGRE